MVVRNVTTGQQRDADGYSVTISGISGAVPMARDAAIETNDIAPGTYVVALSGIATNCTPSTSTDTARVVAAGVDTVLFTIGCDTTFGRLTLLTNTTGAQRDPNGFQVTVTGRSPVAIGIHDSLTLLNVSAGPVIVALSDVSPNCQVAPATDTVMVPAGGLASTAFAIVCDTTFGAIRVTTATTGGFPDADGYGVSIDGLPHDSIGVIDTITVVNILPGTHTVALTGLAANCGVTGAPAVTATVTLGATATVAFTMACPTPASLTITTSATGIALDPDGYTISVDGAGQGILGANDTIAALAVAPGQRTIALRGIVMNCALTGDSSRTITLAEGEMRTESFAATCERPRIAYSQGMDQGYAIWSINPDGTNPIPIVPSPPNGGGRAPSWSPAGDRLVYQTSGGDIGIALARVNADGSGQAVIFDTAGVVGPRWSPIGDRISFVRRSQFATLDPSTGRIWAIDANGTNAAELLPDTVGAFGADWSPTGDRVAISRIAPNGSDSSRSELIILTVGTGTVQSIFAGSDTLFAGSVVRWSPNGETIAFNCWSGRICTTASNGTGLTAHQLPAGKVPIGAFSWSPDGTRLILAEQYFSGVVHIDLVSWIPGAPTWTTVAGGTYHIDPDWR
ncbi:MAG: hypothetical protein ABIQ41_08860 [Gemmatimonadales bacterium]